MAEQPYYSAERAFWDRQGRQAYSVLSPEDQARLRGWIGACPGGALLDLGGGSGALGDLVSTGDERWSLCLDISFEMLRHAYGLRVQGDALQLPFADGSFAMVMAAAFLHHVPGREATVLRECLRVLAPGGRIVGYDPSAKCIQNRIFMQGGSLRARQFSPDERPVDPLALGALARELGFNQFHYHSFSFRYRTLTPFGLVQRYLLTPIARGPLKSRLDRWFYWEARRPERIGARP